MEKIYKNASWDAKKIMNGFKHLLLICGLFVAGNVWGQTYLANQSFDATTFVPTNWTNLVTSGTNTWARVTTGSNPTCSPRSGAGMASFNSFSSPGTGVRSLITPVLNFSTVGSKRITFWMYRDNGYASDADRIEIYTNTSANLTGATLLGTINRSRSLAPVVAANGWYEYFYDVTTTSATTYVIFKAVGAYGNNMFLDDIKVEAAPSCLSPSITTSTSVTSTSANINWTAPSTAPSNGYEWEVRTSGAGGSGATGLVSSGTTAAGVVTKNVTGLTANTSYTVYVRSNCGGSGYSTWSSAGAFTTPCNAVNIPYTQDFESVTVPAIPSCIGVQNAGTGNSWITASPASVGFTSKVMSYTYHGTNAANAWFYTQGLNLTGGTSYTLTYKYGNSSSSWTEKLKTWYGTSASSASMTNALLDHSTINTATQQSASTTFTPSTSGVYYIGFNCYSIANQDKLYVDDISVTLTPSCFPPVLTAATSISTNSASINWNAASPAPSSGYIYEVRTSGTAGSGATGLVASGTSAAGVLTANVSGLIPLTNYNVYVRSFCGGTDTSAWSTVSTFTTLSIQSASSGDWNLGSTWVGGVVPNCESTMIMPGHNVTVNSAGNTTKNLIIRTGGTLTVASGDLTVGCTNNNSYLSDTGTLTVTGGVLNINGQLKINSTASFNQSGGDIIVDGNANGNTANSVPTGSSLFNYSNSLVYINSNLLNLSGGKITIVDPHAGSSSTYDMALAYSGANVTCGSNHSIQFGNGTSTDLGGHTNGFYNYLYVGTGYLSLGNVIVNSASGTNRHVNNTSSVGILGDLTITLGEFRTGSSTVYLAGNLSNSGIMTTDGTLAFATWTGGSASNATSAQSVSGSGTYRNATSSPLYNFNAITIQNTSATGVTFGALNNLSGAAGFSGASSNTISFNGKATTTSGNALLWGTSTARGTTFSFTSGGMTNGSTFAIGTNAAQTGTSISSGADPTSTSGRYPFVNSLGQNRSIYLQRVSPTGTGITAFTFNEVSGTTSVGISDGSYTMDTRSNDNFVFNSYGTSPNATSYNLAITAPAIFGSSPSSAVARIVQSSNIIGTYQAGTVTPTAQRTGLTLSDLGSGEFYMGIHSDDIPFVSVMSGVWEDPTVWNKGTVPSCSDNVTIGSTHTVTSSIASNVSKNLTINSGGTLIVDNGDLTIGCTNNNNTLTNSGTLTVSGGTLNINGSLSHNLGATFNQSGGDINIDGNNAGATATSATSYHLNLANAVNWTGGTLTIVDPHASATATDVLYYNTSANSNISSSHTLKFGDGASTNAGGNSIGFRANTYVSSGRINYGNLIINGGTGTNRVVTGGTYTNVILGNLTINANSEYAPAQTVSVAGNIVNNGIFTQTSTTALQGFSGTTASASTNSQSIGGTGVYRNATTSTANIASLTINNSNATGVSLNVPLSISGTLTMTSGIINTTSSNILRLGTAIASGLLSGTPSNTTFINGPFARTFAASKTSSAFSVTSTLFPVGVSGATPALMSMDINPVTNATGPVIFTVLANNSMSGTAGSGVSNLASVTWSAIPDNTANLTSTQVRLNRADASVTNASKILYATANTDPFEGIPGGSTGTTNSNVSGSTQILTADYKNHFSYGDLVVCTAPVDQASNLVATNKTTTSFTSTFDPASSNPTGYIVVRYTSAQLASATLPTDGTLYSSGTALGGTVVGNYYTAPFTFNQTGLTANTAYTYKIYSFNNTGCAGPTYNATSYDGSITTCGTAYNAPTSVSASSVTINSMDINYTASTSSGVQDHYIDVATNNTFTNFVSGYQNLQIGVAASAGAQVVNVSGLNASTTYFIRIKATDGTGCESSYTTTLTQASDCNAITSLPHTELFTTYLPSICWNEGLSGNIINGPSTISSTASKWAADGFLNNGSAGSAKVNIYSTSQINWLISPSYSIPSTGYRLKFNVGATQFGATTSPTTSWESDDSVCIVVSSGTYNNWTIIKTFKSSNVPSNLGQTEVFDLSTYSGSNVRIGLMAVEGSSDGSADIDFFIDDFTIEQTPVPTITSVTSSNQCGGNTKIVITGTDMNSISSATIGSQSLLPFDSTSSTRLVKTVTTPLNGTTSITNNVGTATNATTITFTNAPALSVDSNNFTICSGSSANVNITSTLTDYTSYTWSPATGVSGSTTATFNPTATTTYTLNATNSGTGCVNSLTRTVTVDQLPSAITLSQGRTTAKCFSALDSLEVSGGTIGSTLNVGPNSPIIGSTSTSSITSQHTKFNALVPITLVSLDFYPTASIGSTYVIRINNSSGTAIFTSPNIISSVTGGTTAQKVTLNASIPIGNDYQILLSTNPGASRNTSGATFPYSNSFISITGNTFDPTYHYFLYNWEVSNINSATFAWSPTTGLFTNRAMTTAYTGTSVNKVYAKPSATQKYYLTATNGACSLRDSIVDSVKNATNLITLASATTTGAVEQCSDANGWTYYATAAKPDEWLFGIYKNGNNFTATVDINVDNTNKFTKSASSNGANQEHASYIMNRYWNVNATGTVGAGVKVRFFIDPQDITDLLNERDNDYNTLKNTTNTSTLAVTGGFEWFKTTGTTYNPSNWTGNKHNGAIVKLTQDAVATLNGQTYVELSGITSFSGGSGGSSFGPSNNGLLNSGGTVGLPVTWKEVKATAKETGNLIQWATSSEKNTKSFVVEYSYDAKEFFEASKDILAAGNSATERFYEFNHNEEYGELVYYRIKQIDLDGKMDYSKAVVVKRTSKLPEFNVSMYPVPLNIQDLNIRIQTVQKTDIAISINDLLGRNVYSETISPAGYNTNHKMNLSHLPQGTYHVTINNGINKLVQVLVVGK